MIFLDIFDQSKLDNALNDYSNGNKNTIIDFIQEKNDKIEHLKEEIEYLKEEMSEDSALDKLDKMKTELTTLIAEF